MTPRGSHRPPRRPWRRGSDTGSIAVELVASVPILVALTMVMVQGLLAVTAVEATTRAARDAARAASSPTTTPYAAADQALPSWVRIQGVAPAGGCAGECWAVTVQIPYGIPGVLTAGSFSVTRRADMPKVRAWG